MLGKPRISFFPTRLINSIKHEHSCKIFYIKEYGIFQNGLEEIKKIAAFLGVPENDELCKAIHEKCHFDKMAVEKAYTGPIADKVFRNGFNMFRKGMLSLCMLESPNRVLWQTVKT